MDDQPLFSAGHWSESNPGDKSEVFSTGDEEVNEEILYQETIRSVHSFMGLTHIPEFHFTYGKDWERANNLWKGKNAKPSNKVCCLTSR